MRCLTVGTVVFFLNLGAGAIPLPDYVIYGKLVLGGRTVSSGDIHLYVSRAGLEELDVPGSWVFDSGGSPFFVFRIPLESGRNPSVGDSESACIGDTLVRIEYEGEVVFDHALGQVDRYGVARRIGKAMRFKRGDANDDGTINLADAISVLMYLFAGGAPPPCRKAADSNDSGDLNIADAIGVLTYLFGRGAPLPEPFEVCGMDPTPDELDCVSYSHCGKVGGAVENKKSKRRTGMEKPPPEFAFLPLPTCDVENNLAQANLLIDGATKNSVTSGGSLSLRIPDGPVPVELSPDLLTFLPYDLCKFLSVRNLADSCILVRAIAPRGLKLSCREFWVAPRSCFHMEISPEDEFESGEILLESSGGSSHRVPVERKRLPSTAGLAFLTATTLSTQLGACGYLDLNCRLPQPAEELDFSIVLPRGIRVAEILPAGDNPFRLEASAAGPEISLRFHVEAPQRIPSVSALCRIGVTVASHVQPGTSVVIFKKATVRTAASVAPLITGSGQVNLRVPQADLDGDGLVLLGSDVPLLFAMEETGVPSTYSAKRQEIPLCNFDCNLDGNLDPEDVKWLVSALLGISKEAESAGRARSLLVNGMDVTESRGSIGVPISSKTSSALSLHVSIPSAASFLLFDFGTSHNVKLLGVKSPYFSVFGEKDASTRLCLLDPTGATISRTEESLRIRMWWLNVGKKEEYIRLLSVMVGNGDSVCALAAEDVRFEEEEVTSTRAFKRGDCNGDGAINLSDAVFLAKILKSTEEAVFCADACDANDDGMLDPEDLSKILAMIFQSKAAVLCDYDETWDDLPPCVVSACNN